MRYDVFNYMRDIVASFDMFIDAVNYYHENTALCIFDNVLKKIVKGREYMSEEDIEIIENN